VDILAEAGIARTVAATAFGLVGGVSVVSRVASGGVADLVGARVTFASGVVVAAAGLVVLAFTATPVTMYASLVTFGAGLGAIAALYAPIVIRAFGRENATAVTGVFTFCSATAGFLAPLVVDALAAVVGSYTLPLVSLGAFTVVGAWLFYWGTDPTADG
jgi:MFS family permease